MDKLGKGYMSICSVLSLTAFFVNSTPQLPCHQGKGLKKEINADSLKVKRNFLPYWNVENQT